MPRAPQAALPSSQAAQAAASARIFTGTSGWAYPTWKPEFYLEGTPSKRFLDHYSRKLSSVEVNYTFRAFPTATTLENWLPATPDFFRFSFKAPQRITHIKRLSDVESDTAYFVSVLEAVRRAGKFGLLLFQLPPNMKADAARLAGFLATPALNGADAPPIAFEFRHESWLTDEIYNLLSEHNAALCIADTDDLATPEVHTAATHTSFRLRRTGAYTPEEIAAFAQRFLGLAHNRDVYVYFRHEDEPTGALNALALIDEIQQQARS